MESFAPIRTALLAYGMSGRVFHAPLLAAHPAFMLQGLWQRRSLEPPAGLAGLSVYAHLEALLADPAVELVVVNTPEPTHYPYAQAALEAGKHVLVEKAFTLSTAEAASLVALAARQQRVLGVFHNRRWDSDFLTLRQVLASGRLGTLRHYQARYDRWRPQPSASWKDQPGPGASVLYNLGSHLIDQALLLFGMPEAVFASLRQERGSAQTPDAFDLTLFYEGMEASLHASYLVAAPLPRYFLRGEAGSFVKYGSDPQEAALARGEQPGPGWGIEPQGQWGLFYAAPHAAPLPVPSLPGNYPALYTALASAIREGKGEHVRGEDGLRVMQVIEAAQRSAAEGRRIALA